jgi:hypothetical protein
MRYLVFLCNTLIGERFASATLLKLPDGSISGLLFLLTHTIIYTSLCFLTWKKSIGNLIDGHGWGTWRQLGRIHEKYPTKKRLMVPPTIGSTVQSTFCQEHQKINVSIYDNSQLPFYESTLCQEHLQVPKNRCKRQDNSHKIWKKVLGKMTCKLIPKLFITIFNLD